MIKGEAVYFYADHTKLKPGIYVAEKFYFPDPESMIVVLDLRFVKPNRSGMFASNVISPKAVHTIEHLGTTFLRNHPYWNSHTISFSPLGCRTGFRLVLDGNYMPGLNNEVHQMVIEMCHFIIGYNNFIPGASPQECGNWREHDLSAAKYHTRRYLKALLEDPCFEYPMPKPEEV